MENMNVVGQGLDERGRRPWEGSSRTDIRSGGLVRKRLNDGFISRLSRRGGKREFDVQ